MQIFEYFEEVAYFRHMKMKCKQKLSRSYRFYFKILTVWMTMPTDKLKKKLPSKSHSFKCYLTLDDLFPEFIWNATLPFSGSLPAAFRAIFK